MEFDFSEEKNDWLKENRGVSFDDVVDTVNNGGLLDITDNKSRNHRNQELLVVLFNNYVYAAPFVINARGVYFLKTVYQSRKLTKKYLKTIYIIF